jgi:putative sporulation protein YtxC
VDFLFRTIFLPGDYNCVWEQAWHWFAADMHQTGQWLREWGFSTEIDYTGDQLILRCRSYPKTLSVSEAHQVWNNVLSSSLSDFFVDKLEDRLLVHMIRHTYGYHNLEEIKRLFMYCEQALNEKDEPYDDAEDWFDEAKVDQRKQIIYQQVHHYLQEAEVLNLVGFYNFRLKAYQEKLHDAIAYAIDEYVLDQEYEKFIQLLRLFVDSQTPKCPLLHVVHDKEREFYVFDQDGNPVSSEELLEHLAEWGGALASQDELIISALINYLPRRVILHTANPELVVIRTLVHIFGPRISVCTHCEQCERWRKSVQFNY